MSARIAPAFQEAMDPMASGQMPANLTVAKINVSLIRGDRIPYLTSQGSPVASSWRGAPGIGDKKNLVNESCKNPHHES